MYNDLSFQSICTAALRRVAATRLFLLVLPLLAVGLMSSVAHAQTTIPDANFAKAIYDYCPNCITPNPYTAAAPYTLTSITSNTITLLVNNKSIVDLTGISGFTALPGGNCNYYGNFGGDGSYGYWWTSDVGSFYGKNIGMDYNTTKSNSSTNRITNGYSVRCAKD